MSNKVKVCLEFPKSGRFLIRTIDYVEDKKTDHVDIVKQTILAAIEDSRSFIFHSDQGLTIIPVDMLIDSVITIEKVEQPEESK